MGNSHGDTAGATPPAVWYTADEGGHRRATKALLSDANELLALVPASRDEDRSAQSVIDRLVRRLDADEALALAVDERASVAARGVSSALFTRLVRLLRSAGSDPIDGPPVMVLRVEPARAVGGFDPAFPGLGIVDLVHRLRQAGHGVHGVGHDLPFDDALHRGFGAAAQCRSEALWLARHGPVTGSGVVERARDRRRWSKRPTPSATEYRRMVLAAVTVARRAGPTAPDHATRSTRPKTELDGARGSQPDAPDRAAAFGAELDRIAAEARRSWAGPHPHEEQVGIGHRADWRFLLPTGPRRSTYVVLADGDGRGDPDSWQWLVDDGWTDHVAVAVGRSTERSTGAEAQEADIVFVGKGGDLDDGLRAAAADCAVVVEQGRSPGRRIRQSRLLNGAGFDRIDAYLVTPDLQQAKRYVPLNSGRGLAWLLASPPPLPDRDDGLDDTDPPSRVGYANRLAAMRRRTRRVAVDAGATMLSTGAAWSGGPSLAPPVGGALGDGLIVATRGSVARSPLLHAEPFVLMTSGHDEGSRAVLTPIGGGTGGPRTVVKIASRPRYNENVEAEVDRIAALRANLGNDPLLPDIQEPLTVGPLMASQEAYAGRWTAADLCFRAPDTRDRVLEIVLRTVDRFTAATMADSGEHDGPGHGRTWSDETFHRYVGDLFDRYRHHCGGDPARDRLRDLLAERADGLGGTPLPLAQRHYDLGPWNVLFGDDRRVTIIDWEVGQPRAAEALVPAGSDQLYFAKYWLHIALGTRSVDDELQAFDFLADLDRPADPRRTASSALMRSLKFLGVPTASTPLITTNVWLEAALHTIERRKARGVEPGSPGRYVDTLARYADRMLDAAPLR